MTSARKTTLNAPLEPLPLDRVMKSLGDPVRLSIVRQLLSAPDGELSCGGFAFDVTKSTFSHHMSILEEAGIVQGRPDGTHRIISLRLTELEKNFPGLLKLIRATL